MKPIVKAHDEHINLGKKRSGSQDKVDFVKDEDTPGKRFKATPSFSEDSARESDKNISVTPDEISSASTEPSTSKGDCDTGPVHQLVAMFGALVAQGEKVVGSLEILISSISADLLADLVIVNMRNLPPNLAMGEGDDEPLLNMKIVGSDSQVKYPQSFVENVLTLSTTFPKIASQLDTRPSLSLNTVVWFFLIFSSRLGVFFFFFFLLIVSFWFVTTYFFGFATLSSLISYAFSLKKDIVISVLRHFYLHFHDNCRNPKERKSE